MSDGYERRVGRYSGRLADELIAVSQIEPGQRVLDLGCGSGALAEALAGVVGADHVVGLDSSADDLDLARNRVPGASFHHGNAEQLPFEDATFDAVLAQLLVHLVDDAEGVAGEMRRVAGPGAVVSTCVWDFAGGMTALRAFWDAAATVDPDLARKHDQAATRPYSTRSELVELWDRAGLAEIESGAIQAASTYVDFDDLWEPMTVPDGGPGHFCARLEAESLEQLRTALFRRLGEPAGSFELEATAWYVRGRA